MNQDKHTKEHFDVIVIGGGASGMMSAGIAGERGKRVLVLEKNKKLGVKLSITGGTRCNITNDEPDIRKFLAVYKDASKFLFSAFSEFDKEDTKQLFERLGLPVVVQERNRCFPKTEKAVDVVKVLEAWLKKNNVVVKTNSPVTKIEKKGADISGVWVGDTEYTAQSFVLATGGMSHPETGSTGDGFAWTHKLGHTVSKPNPTIVPLKVKESWVKKIPGTVFSDCRIYFYLDGKRMFDRRGDILCTHFGISGPLVLNSAYEVLGLLEEGEVTCALDLFPDKNLGELEQYCIEMFDMNKNKTLKNVLREIVSGGIASTLCDEHTLDENKKVHSVSREERKKIVQSLKKLSFTISGSLGYDKAVVSDGGVVLTEIDTKDFRSKKFSNLFFTGDMLHINRPSGGYSLQLCWTTGFVVGRNV